jgi:hypothetical protein
LLRSTIVMSQKFCAWAVPSSLALASWASMCKAARSSSKHHSERSVGYERERERVNAYLRAWGFNLVWIMVLCSFPCGGILVDFWRLIMD